MGDFDEFFELDSENEESKESSDQPSSQTPVAKPSPPEDTKTQPAPPSKTEPPSVPDVDDLLGDFDSLFTEEETPEASTSKEPAPTSPTPPPTPEPQASAAPSPPQPSEPPQPSQPVSDATTSDMDALFDDFFKEEAGAEPPPSVDAAPPPPQADPSQAPAEPPPEKIKDPNEELEDLFSEVSASEAAKDLTSSERVDTFGEGLGIEYTQRKKKIPKAVLVGIPSFIGVVAIVAVAMALFTQDGFFGWKLGKKSADEYQPPSAKVLQELNHRYKTVNAYFLTDTAEGYKKAIVEFEQILKVDPRHGPTASRLAEGILMMKDNFLDSQAKKRVERYVSEGEKYHPGTIETVRVRARMGLSAGDLAKADTTARRALNLKTQDLDTKILLGEIAMARANWDQAAQEFTQAIEIVPEASRAKYFLAVVYLQQGRVEEAETKLRSLVGGTPPHPRSEIELWRLLYAHYGKVEEAKKGLETLIQQKAAQLSTYDLGRTWRNLAEIAEARKDISGAIGAMEKAISVDPVNHVNGFHLGRLYLSQKNYGKASEQFSRISSLSPKTPEYLIYLGHALREVNKPNEALVELKKGLEKAPGNVEGQYQLGLTLRKLGRMDEAIQSFESVLKSDPRHLDTMVELGELYSQKDNFGMAKTQLRAALAIDSQSVRALNAMGEVHLTTRKWDEALKSFQTAEKINPENISVLANMGKTHLVLGKLDKASTYFQKALSLDSTRVDTQIALGELQHQRREYTQALETFRRVLEMQSKNYEARVKLAQVLIDQQAYQEAISELQEASKYKPDYFPTKLNLGIAWRGAGDLDASLDTLNKAISLRPEAADAHYQLGVTHIYRNDLPNAEKAMENAVRYDPKFEAPYVAIGDFFTSRNLYIDAAQYYVKAVKIKKSPQLILKIAESYRNEGKTKDATKYYKQVIGLDKKNSQAYLGLALIAEENRQPGLAAKYYKAARAADPDNPLPHYYLGFIYKGLDQKRAAIRSFRRYLQLDPQSKEKEDIEDQIRRLKQG